MPWDHVDFVVVGRTTNAYIYNYINISNIKWNMNNSVFYSGLNKFEIFYNSSK